LTVDEAWLYRAIRENSAARAIHRFGPHDHVSCDDRGVQPPVFDTGNISPHLAPRFPPRRP
jgi:hypothetical protein